MDGEQYLVGVLWMKESWPQVSHIVTSLGQEDAQTALGKQLNGEFEICCDVRKRLHRDETIKKAFRVLS